MNEPKLFYKKDSKFAIKARLLQNIWRVEKNIPFDKWGNIIDEKFARETAANFLTDKINCLVRYELYQSKNKGKLIQEDRMWENLLSSQPLCFNLFGELHFDYKLATKLFSKLFPERIKEVTDIKFEHSPGRKNECYTGDSSAFDVFVEYISLSEKRGFIGIEVKYAEDLNSNKEEDKRTYKKHGKRYLKISTLSKVFIKNSFKNLKIAPLQQIWRDHLLSLSMYIKEKDCVKEFEEGFFIYLYPKDNEECRNAVSDYKKCLFSRDETESGFYERHLEIFVDTLKQISKEKWITDFEERYLLFNKIEEIEKQMVTENRKLQILNPKSYFKIV